ncbi:helix-turn-helix domain-containing protein [Glaciimonas immobilis]|uniref:Winged helix-turn-helix domain-containing protein n=1 Tax=Glaciimonas immobilis TaxID=728004 RepID=A0A840RLJ7_9BURK|nr:helix-turn-helix domain-containing protein [Glaciimonas immobilis]KAF3999181.1 hypothetical protein HAV38_04385 [Glaciimonas immobilis]MBB5198633.1 hypothetical protein [Glaciimonas immobilis]
MSRTPRKPKTKKVAPGKGKATSGNLQNKVLRCGEKHISKFREALRQKNLLLSSTKTETQLDTLLKILQYRGDAGVNTPEGVGIGFARIATRVFDLEMRGWRIDTLREDVITADGLTHRGIARYVFRGRRVDFIDPQGALDLGAAA